MSHETPIWRFMDLTGDGTGSVDANVNGSITPVVFKMVPDEHQIVVYAVVIEVVDAGAFKADTYGALAALTNGTTFELRKRSDDSVVRDMLAGHPVKHNYDWQIFTSDIVYPPFSAGTNDALTISFNVSTNAEPLAVPDDEYLAMIINDDLTGLVEHHFFVRGHEVE